MRYKGDKSIGQVKEKEVSIIGTVGEAFKHTKKSKHLSVTRYYFLRKGVDLGFPFEFSETFKKEFIGAFKDVKDTKDAASEHIIAQPQRNYPAIMKTHPDREPTEHIKNKGLEDLSSRLGKSRMKHSRAKRLSFKK